MQAEAATGERFGARLAEDLDPPDIRLILEVFCADIERLAGLLRATAASHDAVQFRRAAHSLAGAASAVGAGALERACRRAMAPEILDPAFLGAASAEIDALCTAARDEVTAFLSGMDGG